MRALPRLWSYTLAFALQRREKHGKTSVRVRRTLPRSWWHNQTNLKIIWSEVLVIFKLSPLYCKELVCVTLHVNLFLNRLTPNDPYMSRTAPLTSKLCILYIYSTNVGTEYFKHALYFPFFSLQNAVCFIMLTSLVPILFTFYIQSVLKLKKK